MPITNPPVGTAAPVATPTPPATAVPVPSTPPVADTAPPTTPAPTGLDAATIANPPPAADALPGGGAGGAAALSHIVARTLASTGKNPYELVPGRVPNAIGLVETMQAASADPAAQEALKKLIAQYEQSTGVSVHPALVTAALANPARLVEVFQLTPAQMSEGFGAVNARPADPAAKKARAHHQLPRTFDLADLDRANIKRPESKLKTLAPGISTGDIKSDLPDDQARRNVAMAEVFGRLADNSDIPPSKQFKLQYNGQEYRRLDALVQALVDSGHQIDVEIDHRIANFSALHAQTPDGRLLDVPAPLMVRTGIKDAGGNEAVVPAVHSELVIHVRPGPTATGPAVNADVKWYQGVSATGFFPCGIHVTPEWAGKKTADHFAGTEALRAVKLAGLLGDVINASAEAQQLKAAGYGVTGVCNDSVAIIQHALTGRATGYPLLMRDESLKSEIDHRLADRDRRDDPDYQALATTIAAVPSDVAANPTLRERALASIPWADGAEPFTSTVEAKRILNS